jgi:CRP-like cAMP-binding protein
MTGRSLQRLKLDGNAISSIPFFSTLLPEEIDQVEQLFRKRRYAKDEIVLFEEDASSYMYLVYSGKVRVVKQNEEGREQILTIHKKNDFFGEMALLDGKTAPATIIAHEDAVIGVLSKNDFEQHLLSHETIRRKIIDLLCLRLRDSWAVIKILSFDSAENRVMAVLERLQDLCGVKDDRGVIITMKLTHQQIADYASLTRETVSKILKNLEKTGFISVLEGKAILLNHAFLDRMKNAIQVRYKLSLDLNSAGAINSKKDYREVIRGDVEANPVRRV